MSELRDVNSQLGEKVRIVRENYAITFKKINKYYYSVAETGFCKISS